MSLHKKEERSRTVGRYSTEYEEGRTRERDVHCRENVGAWLSRHVDPEHPRTRFDRLTVVGLLAPA